MNPIADYASLNCTTYILELICFIIFSAIYLFLQLFAGYLTFSYDDYDQSMTTYCVMHYGFCIVVFFATWIVCVSWYKTKRVYTHKQTVTTMTIMSVCLVIILISSFVFSFIGLFSVGDINDNKRTRRENNYSCCVCGQKLFSSYCYYVDTCPDIPTDHFYCHHYIGDGRYLCEQEDVGEFVTNCKHPVVQMQYVKYLHPPLTLLFVICSFIALHFLRKRNQAQSKL